MKRARRIRSSAGRRQGEGRDIGSIGELLDALAPLAETDEVHWFRGHHVDGWQLLPSLARDPRHLAAEVDLLARFQQSASLLLSPVPGDAWGWLTIMQHHGCPTRLLDWSESPLVALYFAVAEQRHYDQDGALWVLRPQLLNSHSGIRPQYPRYIPNLAESYLANYTTAGMHDHATSLNPIAVVCARNTHRMQAQLGVFTVSHRERVSIDAVADGRHAWCYRIPREAKPRVLRELGTLGIRQFQLFPELQSLGELLKSGL